MVQYCTNSQKLYTIFTKETVYVLHTIAS